MPDRELPENLKARLDDELTSGAPLVSPLASQARYARAAATAVPTRHVTRGLVSAAAASAALILVAAAVAPTPAREWIGRSVGSFTQSVKHAGDHSGSATPSAGRSPESEPSETSEPTPHESPEPSESPESRESPEPSGSPEPSESAEPSPATEPPHSPESPD